MAEVAREFWAIVATLGVVALCLLANYWVIQAVEARRRRRRHVEKLKLFGIRYGQQGRGSDLEHE